MFFMGFFSKMNMAMKERIIHFSAKFESDYKK